MSHTHPKYAWEPIDGTKVTRKCATLKKKQVFNAWTKYGNGKNISLTTSRFGLLHGVLVQTADTINIECLICKYSRSLEFRIMNSGYLPINLLPIFLTASDDVNKKAHSKEWKINVFPIHAKLFLEITSQESSEIDLPMQNILQRFQINIQVLAENR